MISTHKAEVILIEDILVHPNADKLEVIPLFGGGYQTVVSKGQFSIGDKGIFIPPDSLVNTTRPEFSFLSSRCKNNDPWIKIRANKFRGVQSYGLLVNAPVNAEIGSDYANQLEIKHYEPVPESEDKIVKGTCLAPPGSWGKYDIDSLRRYLGIFEPNEMICVSEKLNGENCRAVVVDNKFYVGSRSKWWEDPNCNYCRSISKYPQIEKFCYDHPGYIVYGESYGKVKYFIYGKTEPDFACFDICKPDKKYIDVEQWLDICKNYDIPTVPIIVTNFPFCFATIEAFSSGPSLIPGSNNIREGCVIKPMIEGWNYEIGRKILKLVSPDFLNK